MREQSSYLKHEVLEASKAQNSILGTGGGGGGIGDSKDPHPMPYHIPEHILLAE